MPVRNIKAIVDRAHSLNLSIREMNQELDSLKIKIRQHSFETGLDLIKGDISKARLGKYVISSIDPIDLWKKLVENLKFSKT